MSDFLPTSIQLSYLVASALFIVGLKKLGSPATARQGNLIGAIGMLIAVVATLLDQRVLNYEMIAVGIAIGSAIGAIMAYKVQMTSMPQMVGLLNGFGGAASALVAVGEFWRVIHTVDVVPVDETVTIVLSILVGGVTFTGSLLAFAKLQELVPGAPITFAFQQPINLAIVITFLVGSGLLIANPHDPVIFLTLTGLSLVLGILFVLPIGGADTPVVISLLNSFSGVAASAAGFMLMNNILIIAGALVGASGIILTELMCRAMNRTLVNVLFSAFGSSKTASGESAIANADDRTVRSIDA
ncbi:MAG: NAD(P)(+) transhydrogenase (Re/Si-specific) subunit beta, partial [Cyanobacteria bacterium CAN_BIN43]|nr:NAD(P)(+) transhydrogenase (Re/Si-specific) subunit beta [Cyanobacteria bacterium CAN_BIN43]